MQNVKAFQTDDGKLFFNESDAIAHEVGIKLTNILVSNAHETHEQQVADVVGVMMDNASEFAHLLMLHTKASPKDDTAARLSRMTKRQRTEASECALAS